MKKITISLFLSIAFINFSIAQLTLERADGEKEIIIPNNELIGLKYLVPSSDKCECYKYFKGKLISASPDSAMLLLYQYKQTSSYNENGVAAMETVNYKYSKKTPPDAYTLSGLKSIQYFPESRKNLKKRGAALLFLSAVQGFLVSPFLGDDARKISDIAVLGGAGLGVALTLIPKKKDYNFQPSKKKPYGHLWKVKK